MRPRWGDIFNILTLLPTYIIFGKQGLLICYIKMTDFVLDKLKLIFKKKRIDFKLAMDLTN